MGKLSRDKRDVYYRRAKEQGYRARSAYKLKQIIAEFDLFCPGGRGVHRAVDLCAAPGGWSQVLVEHINATTAIHDEDDEDDEQRRKEANLTTIELPSSSLPPTIVAVDLWPIEPLQGVHFIRGDITSHDTATSIIDYYCGERADLVVCDGAPDVTGLHAFDEYIQHQLLLAAINITTHILRPGGTFVAKIFRGRDVGLIYAQLRLLFADVTCAKPAASRNASIESFAVCRGFGHGILDVDKVLNLELEGGWDESCGGVGGLREHPGVDIVPIIVPFVACAGLVSDGNYEFMDSDKSYAVSESLTPLSPPIQQPFDAGMAKAKEAKTRRGEGD